MSTYYDDVNNIHKFIEDSCFEIDDFPKKETWNKYIYQKQLRNLSKKVKKELCYCYNNNKTICIITYFEYLPDVVTTVKTKLKAKGYSLVELPEQKFKIIMYEEQTL